MGQALVLVNGVPRMQTIDAAATIYDETYTVPGGGLSSGTPVSLPSGGVYQSKELKVYFEGQFLEPLGVDYSYVGSGTRTQVTFVGDYYEGEKLRFRVEGNPDNIYDQTNVPTATITAGNAIDLPSGEQYYGNELKVYLNGQFMEDVIDWNPSGSGSPYTAIMMTRDVFTTDRIRFRKD